MPWLALGITIGLMFAYLAFLRNDWLDDEEKEEIVLEEYWADALFMRIYYNSEYNSVQADFGEFDEKNLIRVTMYTTEAPQGAIQQKIEGEWIEMGSAIVRVIEGSRQVISISYIKE